MSNIILCNLSDANEIIEEEKLFWINEVLDKLHISEEVFEADDIKEFRYRMDELGVEVEMCSDGTVSIYKKQYHNGPDGEGWLPCDEKHLIAQWKKPERIKRLEPDGKLYYELHLKEWCGV